MLFFNERFLIAKPFLVLSIFCFRKRKFKERSLRKLHKLMKTVFRFTIVYLEKEFVWTRLKKRERNFSFFFLGMESRLFKLQARKMRILLRSASFLVLFPSIYSRWQVWVAWVGRRVGRSPPRRMDGTGWRDGASTTTFTLTVWPRRNNRQELVN